MHSLPNAFASQCIRFPMHSDFCVFGLGADARGAGAVCGVHAAQPFCDAPLVQAAAALHQVLPRLQRHGPREPRGQRGARGASLLHPRPGRGKRPPRSPPAPPHENKQWEIYTTT
eukprot:9301286-Pyramimonas_sp.AAC.1